MKAKLKAPVGYKYRDKMTGLEYAEVVVDEKKRGRFTLVPSIETETITY